MRTAILACGIVVTASVLAVVFVLYWGVGRPAVGPDVERICAETMQRSAPDMSWVAPGREEKVHGDKIRAVTLGELPVHNGELVRVKGLLHVEFEWVGLYPSRSALEEGWRAPWVTLNSLWPDEPYWETKGPSVSDRCAVVEGTYSAGPGGHFRMFNGTIRDVLRLDVWSTPHRPFITRVPRAIATAPRKVPLR